MKHFITPITAFVVSTAFVIGVFAQMNNIPPPNPNCQPLGTSHLNGQHYPTTIEPEFPIWCYNQPAALPPTRSSGANDWVDTFDNNADAITAFNDHDMGYRQFSVFYGGPFKFGSFVNVNHWMIDLVDISDHNLFGGVLVSPDRQFKFENGKMVIEADAAAGSDAMGGASRFYEIDLTPASAPTIGVDTAYGYGSFGGIGAIGCRLERNTDAGGNFVCTMYDNSGRATDGRCVLTDRPCSQPQRPGRVWETQGGGTQKTAQSVQGGYPQWPIPNTNLHLGDVWRTCQPNELDLHCRDRFRMEVTKDSIHLFVNGYPAMLIDGLFAVNPDTGADNRIPDFWFQQGARPYFTSWINSGQHTPTRWHWDRFTVNPHASDGSFLPPSAAPSFCLGSPRNTCPDPGSGTPEPTPVATQTAAPTSTPTSGVAPTSTPTPKPGGGGGGGGGTGGAGTQNLTFDDLPNPNRPLNGQYPSGVADWGNNNWYLSAPYGAFSSQSIGFNGAGPTSESVRFASPKRLLSLDAYNGGDGSTTISVACAGQPTIQQSLAANQVATIQTRWTGTCSSVTISSSNGWATNFDNVVIDSGPAVSNRTVTFDDLPNPNRPLNGQYPTGVIDWGTNGWYLAGPYGAFDTNSVGFNGPSRTSQGFGFTSPHTLVKVDVYNGGTSSSTVTLSCDGHPTVSATVAAKTKTTMTTNWTSPCNSVTVTSSNGWKTNFDNLVIQ